LMHMIGLLDTPSEGRIYLEGATIADLSEDQRSRLRSRKLGFVFQSYNLLPRHNAIENVALPLVYSGVGSKERVRRAEQCLQAVGMGHRARHFPKQLSGGEQQRVAIARSLVCAPAIILADEPTGALDSRTGDEVLRLFRALGEIGQTVVIVTHDHKVAEQCKRIIRLFDGRVVADDVIVPQTPKEALGI
ncbi:ABC transporter ATP-binding protein, partial [Bradyrhizobium sp.]|uniref:ABC transporter ATP-binding protein n=1 Tax=Bradyrhizobium sp. TaxID=376 RepID=UPI003C3C8524